MHDETGNETHNRVADPLANEVIAILAAAKRRPVDTMSLDGSLVELGFDSLDTLTVMFEFENKYEISIPDEQVRSLRTVGDVVEGIRRLLADRANHA